MQKAENKLRQTADDNERRTTMKENRYSEMIRKYKEEAKNIEISDQDMENATGGVGGANEATCPECGRPMSRPQDHDPNGPHSDVWTCDACGSYQFFSDAETIEMIRAMEKAGMQGQISYPVWWSQVNH